jgi:hypothetical protein
MAYQAVELLKLERRVTGKGTVYFSLAYGGVNEVGTLAEMIEKIPEVAEFMNSQAIIDARGGKRGELKIW